MPAVLTERRFFDDRVPATWAPVLDDLRAFVEQRDRLKAGEAVAEAAPLLAFHDRLVESSASLLEPRALDDLEAGEIERLFATAVLFLARLAECIQNDQPVIDTAGSRALPAYEADFYDSPESLAALTGRLQEEFGLAPEVLEELRDEVAFETGDARRKQAVARALRERFGLGPGAPDLDQRVLAMFAALFPGVPMVAEEVRLILTGTLVFFCIPFQGDALTTPRYQTLDEAGCAPIRSFLEEVGRFKQERFAHFPAFGFLRVDELAPDLLDELAGLSSLDPREVAHELQRMVTILPLAEVDKYVVHDVWGHSWQGGMLRFAQAYEAMAGYSAAFGLDTRTTSDEGRTLSLAECFRRGGAEVRLDERRYVQFVYGVLRERLPLALSAVLAEVMADVAEFKLLAETRDLAPELKNSSLLEAHPSKLDLTLQDVEFYFDQATKAFRLFARRRSRQAAIEGALIDGGASPSSAQAAVRRAAEVWRDLETGPLARRLEWRAEGEVLHTNVFTRVMLNFVGIHRAILLAYRQLHPPGRQGSPLKGFRDLLVLGASVFFEADRARNLWRVDEFLSLHFVELCRRLEAGGG